MPGELEKDIGYIEPILYNEHVSVLFIKKSVDERKKRVNILFDMSRYHSERNILDNTIMA